MKKLVLCLIILVVIIVSLFSVTKYDPTPLTIPIPAQVTTPLSREAVKEDWVNALRSVVDQTQDVNAKEVLAMLETQTVLAIPTVDGLKVMGHDKPIRIVVLLPEDSQYPMWKEILDEKVAGAYFLPQAEAHAIVLKNGNEMSLKSKGLLLSHEGTHALHYLKKPFNEQMSNIQFCREEQSTHAAENSLLSSLGGKPYENFVAARVANMASTLEQTDAGVHLAMPDKSYKELRNIFGPWQSEKEGFMWVAGAWTDTMFRFVDLYGSGTQSEKDEMKASGLCSLYQYLGVIPKEG